jgi:hypothetical protein
MDSAMFLGRKPLLPEIPKMKSSRPIVHHNTALRCIVMVRNFASFQQSQQCCGLLLQMHRIGDLRGGACA